MENNNTCLLCQSNQLKLVNSVKRAKLLRCMSCGFVFCRNIPSDKLLKDYYSDYPRIDYLSPITRQRYQELLDELEPYRRNNRILDIGCGNGLFLSEAKKRGWEVYGTEYVPVVQDTFVEKDAALSIGVLSEIGFENDFFDVVTMFEVIEHINNPHTHVKEISRILRPSGLFYFTTPNFNSFSRTLLGDKWNIIEYPEHLSYYTPKSVNQFLNDDFGFDLKDLKTTGISLSRFNESRNDEGHTSDVEHSEDEKLRKRIETNFVLKMAKSTINSFLTLTKKGDTIKAYLEKRASK